MNLNHTVQLLSIFGDFELYQEYGFPHPNKAMSLAYLPFGLSPIRHPDPRLGI
jgi:hypothetical protein